MTVLGHEPSVARRSEMRRALLLGLVCVLSFLVVAGWGLYLQKASQSAAPVSRRSVGAPSASDIGFSQAMSVHHQQAVYMAQIVLRRSGVSSEIYNLANTIELDQMQEIGLMQGFLNLWNAPPLGAGNQMGWMTRDPTFYGMSGGMGQSPMPGLATQAELNNLAQLTGRRLEVRFLQLMLNHHLGGIEMAMYAQRYARTPQVRELAGRIALDQSLEVTLMQRLLRVYGGQPLKFTRSPALTQAAAVANAS